MYLPVGALSGGQKKLVGLAKLLAVGADLLLLDEPDNHLDLLGKAYLERFIASFSGTVVIVSHDRYLLDETVTLVAEVEDRRLTVYPGSYSAYAVEKRLRLLRHQQRYEAQQKEIARIEAAIARFEHWASIVINERHARQARSRRRMLERMDRVEKPVLERRRMGLELNGWRGSQTNNLDLPSCEVLESALDEFEGTVMVISHDRYFLDRVVDRIVELDSGALMEYLGDYTYYQEERARQGQDR